MTRQRRMRLSYGPSLGASRLVPCASTTSYVTSFCGGIDRLLDLDRFDFGPTSTDLRFIDGRSLALSTMVRPWSSLNDQTLGDWDWENDEAALDVPPKVYGLVNVMPERMSLMLVMER